MKVRKWAVGLGAIALAAVVGATAACGSAQSPPTSIVSSSPVSSPAPTVPATGSSPIHLTGHGSADTTPTWAGYCAVGRHFTSVSATWVQPRLTVSGRRRRTVAIWVGLDGYNGTTVEQIGTEGDSQGGSDPWVASGAWWEMYPAPNHDIATARVAVGSQSMEVSAGDTLTASVTRVSGDRFRLSLTNETQGEHFSVIKTSAEPPADTAEVIVEMPEAPPSWGLAFFGPVRFSHCRIDDRPIGDWRWVRLDMKPGARLQASPSDLGADGESFAAWRR